MALHTRVVSTSATGSAALGLLCLGSLLLGVGFRCLALVVHSHAHLDRLTVLGVAVLYHLHCRTTGTANAVIGRALPGCQRLIVERGLAVGIRILVVIDATPLDIDQ